MNLREAILAADDRKPRPVDVPEWGSLPIFVRLMSGAEREEFEAYCSANKAGGNVLGWRAKAAVLTVCDADGKHVFTDADIDALNAKSGPALVKIWDAASEVNKLSQGDIDDLGKN